MSATVVTTTTPRFNAVMERAEGIMLEMPQVECPVIHHFAPGVYMREMRVPAGTIVIGHEHKTEHLNVVMSGRAVVMIDGVRHDVRAPYAVTSKPGTRKIALVLEDMVWATVHATTETDPEKLEAALITKSQTWLERCARDAHQLRGEVVQNRAELTGGQE